MGDVATYRRGDSWPSELRGEDGAFRWHLHLHRE